MKIEFKCKIDLDGTWYYTTIDGKMVSGSFLSDKSQAYNTFLAVVENNGVVSEIITLETITI